MEAIGMASNIGRRSWRRGTLWLVLVLVGACSNSQESGDTVWKKYTAAGIDAQQHGRFAEAAQTFEAALKEAQRLGPEDARVAQSMSNLALADTALKKYDEAEKLLKQALAMDEKRAGKESAQVGDDLHNLGAVYTAAEKYDEAAETYQRAVALREKLFGPHDPRVGITVTNYAAMLRKAKRPEAEMMTNLAETIEKQAIAAATSVAAGTPPPPVETAEPSETPAPDEEGDDGTKT